MSIATNINASAHEYLKSRKAAICDHPSIFTDIFKEDTNIAIWQRTLSTEVEQCVSKLLDIQSNFRSNLIVSPDDVVTKLIESNSKFNNAQALLEHIAELTDMFCLLFELKQVGLRLTVLDSAMCPRFHVDKVPHN